MFVTGVLIGIVIGASIGALVIALLIMERRDECGQCHAIRERWDYAVSDMQEKNEKEMARTP